MSKRAHSTPEAVTPAVSTEETFRSIWRKYCAKPGTGHADMSPILRTLKNTTARLKYRHVRHIRFKQLSWVGYDVQEFDDVAAPYEP